MNVASRLCEEGKNVCVLDFDLEAPGLDAFELTHREGVHPGIVEYIDEYLEQEKTPPIRDYAHRVELPHTSGRLTLIASGKKDANYQASLGRLDWKLLYQQRQGFHLIENLKRSIEKEFNPDYLIIDSRTGLTDISGICTQQLPDLVVLLFNLNEQNVRGTSQVLKSIASNKLGRSIQALLVASPIPDVPDSLEIRAKRFENARLMIGASPELIIPYDPFICFRESIVSEDQSKGLSKAYNELCQKIIARNEKDVLTLLNKATRFREAGELQLAQLKGREILDLYPKNAHAWFELGRSYRMGQDFTAAAKAFNRSYELAGPDEIFRERILGELASAALQSGDKNLAAKTYMHLIDTSNNFELLLRTSELFSDRGEPELALSGLSKVLSTRPDTSALFARAQSLAALHKYEEAFEAYSTLAKAAPGSLSVVFNAGFTAFAAKRHDYSTYFERAIKLFETDGFPKANLEAANVAHAMSFAYLIQGNRQKSIQLLRQALEKTDNVESGRVFIFPDYRYSTVVEFRSRVREELETQLSRTESLQ
jgi:tetratricopeptide (TPR) repeat protein